jgi:hypothetical protein
MYLTVRRAARCEKTPLGAVHRRPQQEAGEKCGLVFLEQRDVILKHDEGRERRRGEYRQNHSADDDRYWKAR